MSTGMWLRRRGRAGRSRGVRCGEVCPGSGYGFSSSLGDRFWVGVEGFAIDVAGVFQFSDLALAGFRGTVERNED